MSSWLSPSREVAAVRKDRPVSYGGLGGCIGLRQIDESYGQRGESKRKKRPGPLTPAKSDGLLPTTSPAVCSASSRTPLSARSLFSPFLWPAVDKKADHTSIRLQSTGLSASRSKVGLSGDEQPCSLATRVKSVPSTNDELFELPGSLLLPSQGFPPPPETPTKLLRRTTNESDLSSTPPLTTCNTISSDTSSTMVFWKVRAHEEEELPSDSDGWEPASTHDDKTLSALATISKPFNLMSIDELLETLSGCSSEVLDELWVPEIRRKLTALKAVVQSAETRSLYSYESLIMMDNDLEAIAKDARRFPNLYDQVIKDAGLLAEKNIDTFKEQVDEVEDQLVSLDAENQHLRAEAKLRSKEANAAKYNAYAIVDSIRSVLEEALRRPQLWDRLQCQNMHRVLQDYPADSQQPGLPTLRLPQQIYHQLVADLRESQDTITALRSVAGEQVQLIKEQSGSMMEGLERYEHIVQALQTRDHEVLLLDGRNKELEDALHDYEGALQHAEQDRVRIHALEEQLDQATQQYEVRLEEKDQALLQMRQEFDQIQRRLLTTQIDLRNAQTSQALADGEGLNKPRPSLPSSYSSFALNVRQLTEQSEPSRPQQTYRIMGPIAGMTEPQEADIFVTNSPIVSRSLAQPVHPRRLSDPFQDAPSVTRRRGASLDSGKILIHRPNDGAKPLPSPPAISPEIPSTATLGHPGVDDDAVTAENGATRPSPQFHMRDLHGPETPASGRRILSIIAEASQEGSSSEKTYSATSSEKDNYRNSISALDLLNSQSSRASNEFESPVMHASWAEVHRHHDPRNVASRDLYVSKMYHQDRQHQ